MDEHWTWGRGGGYKKGRNGWTSFVHGNKLYWLSKSKRNVARTTVSYFWASLSIKDIATGRIEIELAFKPAVIEGLSNFFPSSFLGLERARRLRCSRHGPCRRSGTRTRASSPSRDHVRLFVQGLTRTLQKKTPNWF